MRDGAVLYESLIGLSADGSPGHTTRLLGEVEAAAEAAGGWGGVEALAVGDPDASARQFITKS